MVLRTLGLAFEDVGLDVQGFWSRIETLELGRFQSTPKEILQRLTGLDR